MTAEINVTYPRWGLVLYFDVAFFFKQDALDFSYKPI